MQTCFDSREADTKVVGHLCVGPMFGVLQEQDFGIARGELRHRFADHLGPFFRHQPARRIVVRCCFVLHSAKFGGAIQQLALPAAAPPIQQRLQNCQAIEPGGHTRGVTDRRLLFDRSERNLLQHFVNRLSFTSPRKDYCSQPAVVLGEKQGPVEGKGRGRNCKNSATHTIAGALLGRVPDSAAHTLIMLPLR